ncbi:MAG: phosphoribosylformylglycinamidine synthase subunit PurS [Thermoleophilia bacterium]|nr:phosphoribosylformylglycinamidine synthase subunit PurS [Thermoleophilia bacterium]
MRVTVLIRPKPGILDPQGEAVRDALAKLGLEARAVHVGRVVDLELDDTKDAQATVEHMCRELLANPLIESYEILAGEERA